MKESNEIATELTLVLMRVKDNQDKSTILHCIHSVQKHLVCDLNVNIVNKNVCDTLNIQQA